MLAKMEKLVGSKYFAEAATIYITNACNFRCRTCCQGEPGNIHMTLEDFNFLLNILENPFFDELTIYGGEVRVHPRFEELALMASNFFTSRGIGLSSTMESHQHAKRRHLMAKSVGPEENQMTAKELNALRATGEWQAHVYAVESQLRRAVENRSVELKIYTNGLGMDAPENCDKLFKHLYNLGMRNVSVSADPPHQEYAKQIGVEVNDRYICNLRDIHGRYRERSGIPKDMDINLSGTGRFVIPIRKARGLSWEDRIKLGFPDFYLTPSLSGIISDLKREFIKWRRAFHSHCYCDLARFYDNAKWQEGVEPKYRFDKWHPIIDVNLESQFCTFGIIPGVGNYRDLELDEILYRAAHNRLYQIIGTEGPQGLARLLTPFYEDREEDLLAWFIERTPCGMCEDLMKQYPDQIQELLHTPAQV